MYQCEFSNSVVMGENTGKHLISNEVFNQTLHKNSSSCKFPVKICLRSYNDH